MAFRFKVDVVPFRMKLGSGVCPVARLLGRGVRVALGTDGAASNNDLDLLAEARIAGLLSSGIAATPGDLVATDLLREVVSPLETLQPV